MLGLLLNAPYVKVFNRNFDTGMEAWPNQVETFITFCTTRPYIIL
jgi:hypothetical protein